MKSLDRILTKVFFYLLPFTLLLFLAIRPDSLARYFEVKAVMIPVSTLLVIWLISAIYFFSALIFSPGYRERVLTRLANMKERDEREERIVGSAARQTFLFTLAALMTLLAISTVRYNESTHNPQDSSSHSISIGNLTFFDSRPEIGTQTREGVTEEIHQYGIPLSKTGLLFTMVLLQLAVFKLTVATSQRTG